MQLTDMQHQKVTELVEQILDSHTVIRDLENKILAANNKIEKTKEENRYKAQMLANYLCVNAASTVPKIIKRGGMYYYVEFEFDMMTQTAIAVQFTKCYLAEVGIKPV